MPLRADCEPNRAAKPAQVCAPLQHAALRRPAEPTWTLYVLGAHARPACSHSILPGAPTHMYCRALSLLAVASAALVAPTPALSQAASPDSAFTKTEALIPMRDGVKLYTTIYAPKDETGPLPIILSARPTASTEPAERASSSYLKDLADDGYIFVFQDIRGRFKSEGTFVMLRPPRDTQRSEGDRREHRHLRHHRLAAEERAEQQRPRRHARHLLRGWLTVMAHARSAPGAQGRLAAGVARRHVPRRRLPSQRRLPPQLRLRVRGHDGDRQGERPASSSTATTPTSGTCSSGPLSNVNDRSTSTARCPTWNDFVAHPELRRVLEEAGGRCRT